MQLKNLKTNFLGRNFVYYDEIDSTQAEIWRRVNNGTDLSFIKDGTLVMADIQTKGKGTHGRTWYTDEKNNIAFSLFAQMNCNIKKIEGITIEIARVINNIFDKKYGIALEIKEPNDIVYQGKKIGGILTESKVISEQVKYLVIGIGLNTSKVEFADEIKDIATSIKKEFNIDINPKEIIADFCNEFEKEIIRRKE